MENHKEVTTSPPQTPFIRNVHNESCFVMRMSSFFMKTIKEVALFPPPAICIKQMYKKSNTELKLRIFCDKKDVSGDPAKYTTKHGIFIIRVRGYYDNLVMSGPCCKSDMLAMFG